MLRIYFVTCFALSSSSTPHPSAGKPALSVSFPNPALLIANLEFSGLHCCSFVKVHIFLKNAAGIFAQNCIIKEKSSYRISRQLDYHTIPILISQLKNNKKLVNISFRFFEFFVKLLNVVHFQFFLCISGCYIQVFPCFPKISHLEKYLGP